MGAFFFGWRRKTGMLTLLMALVFMGGWIRGFAFCDIATYSYIQGWQRLNASCYGLVWSRFKNDDINVKYGNELQVEHHPLKNASGIPSANGPHPVDFHFSSEDDETIWHWQAFGFHFGEAVGIKDQLRMSLWAIPYWSIVVPLTLLSAFLLLTKPQTTKPGSEHSNSGVMSMAGTDNCHYQTHHWFSNEMN